MTELRDVTCHMGSHSVTCHPTQVNAPALTPASKLVLDLPTPDREGWKAELNLGYPAMHRPGVELATSRSQVRRPNHYTTEPPLTMFRVARIPTNRTHYVAQKHKNIVVLFTRDSIYIVKGVMSVCLSVCCRWPAERMDR